MCEDVLNSTCYFVFKLNLKVFSWLVLVGENFLIDEFIYDQIKMSCKIVWPYFSYLFIYFSVLPLERMCVLFWFSSKTFLLVCEVPAVLVWNLEGKEASVLYSFPSPFFVSTFVLWIHGPSFKFYVSVVRKSAYLNPCC